MQNQLPSANLPLGVTSQHSSSQLPPGSIQQTSQVMISVHCTRVLNCILLKLSLEIVVTWHIDYSWE